MTVEFSQLWGCQEGVFSLTPERLVNLRLKKHLAHVSIFMRNFYDLIKFWIEVTATLCKLLYSWRKFLFRQKHHGCPPRDTNAFIDSKAEGEPSVRAL